jgi:hypothetical protein
MSGSNKGILKLVLDEHARKEILKLVRPVHPDVKATHVTIMHGVDRPTSGLIERWLNLGMDVGIKLGCTVDNGRAQAVLVAMSGCLEEAVRVSGRVPHITISCAEGCKPVESNDAIREAGIGSLDYSFDEVFGDKAFYGKLVWEEFNAPSLVFPFVGATTF